MVISDIIKNIVPYYVFIQAGLFLIMLLLGSRALRDEDSEETIPYIGRHFWLIPVSWIFVASFIIPSCLPSVFSDTKDRRPPAAKSSASETSKPDTAISIPPQTASNTPSPDEQESEGEEDTVFDNENNEEEMIESDARRTETEMVNTPKRTPTRSKTQEPNDSGNQQTSTGPTATSNELRIIRSGKQ